jgi:haloalkane dehalogenase
LLTLTDLWRNIIPYLSDDYRVIALDLIGMGKSDKPDVDYSYVTHYEYVHDFIDGLALGNITLVLHDWGTVIGLDFASAHEADIAGVAFMEAIVPPAYPAPDPMEGIFASFRTEGEGEELVLEQNAFVEQILPGAVLRELTEEEMDHYREPYPTPESRIPTLEWPRQLPAGGEPARNVNIINAVGEWMERTDVPMLHLWARPGAINDEAFAAAMVERVNNIQSSFVGAGSHFIQEDQPEMIGRILADWRRRLDQD